MLHLSPPLPDLRWRSRLRQGPDDLGAGRDESNATATLKSEDAEERRWAKDESNNGNAIPRIPAIVKATAVRTKSDPNEGDVRNKEDVGPDDLVDRSINLLKSTLKTRARTRSAAARTLTSWARSAVARTPTFRTARCQEDEICKFEIEFKLSRRNVTDEDVDLPSK